MKAFANVSGFCFYFFDEILINGLGSREINGGFSGLSMEHIYRGAIKRTLFAGVN